MTTRFNGDIFSDDWKDVITPIINASRQQWWKKTKWNWRAWSLATISLAWVLYFPGAIVVQKIEAYNSYTRSILDWNSKPIDGISGRAVCWDWWIPQLCHIEYPHTSELVAKVNNAANFAHAWSFMLDNSNVPSNAAMQWIISQIKTYMKHNKITHISIAGVSTPEWTTSEAIIGKDQMSKNLNQKLALDRANYVRLKLLEAIPWLQIDDISWIVKSFSDEDISRLCTIAKWCLKWIDRSHIANIDAINIFISEWNKSTTRISIEDRDFMMNLMSRSTTVSIQWESNSSFIYDLDLLENIRKDPRILGIYIFIILIFSVLLLWWILQKDEIVTE